MCEGARVACRRTRGRGLCRRSRSSALRSGLSRAVSPTSTSSSSRRRSNASCSTTTVRLTLSLHSSSLPPHPSPLSSCRTPLHPVPAPVFRTQPPPISVRVADRRQVSSPPWASRPVSGVGPARSTKATRNSPRSVRPSPPPSSPRLASLASSVVTHADAGCRAVGVPIEQLQGGKLAIYELMAEESAVNYWEKYGNVRPSSSRVTH